MRAIIRRPVGQHFTSNVSANSEFRFQLELLKSSFYIARCFGPFSVVSDLPSIIGIKPPHGIQSTGWPCGPWTYLVVRTRAHSQFNSVPRRLSHSVLSTDPPRLRFCAGSGHFGGICGIKPPRGI